MRAAVLGLGVLLACGGGGPRSAEVSNRGGTPMEHGWTCPEGDELSVRLDDDELPDRVRLSPSALAVTCLEIHATRAPPLVCAEASPPMLPHVEPSDGKAEELGVAPCDPMGAAVTAFGDAAAPPTGRDFFAAMLGDVAPTRTGLRLSGGDATVALVWRKGGWAWVEMGF